MATLIEEEPYSAVVKSRHIQTTCSKCFAWNYLEGPERVHLSRCAGCHVLYYCSKKCQKGDWEDHKVECRFLRSFKADSIPGEHTRLVFRMLIKSKSQPDFKAFNDRTYDSLMDHCDMHVTCSEAMADVEKTYDEIHSYMGPKTPSFEMVFLAYSKKATNSFSIFDSSPAFDSRGSGIYLGLSVHDHSCRPDAFVMVEGSKLQLRTTKNNCIYSEKLTICYPSAKFFCDTLMRRLHLYSCYVFHCKCEECEDMEADKKRTSGQPTCCRKGWFSITDLRCSICDKEVPFEMGKMAEVSNETLRETIIISENHRRDNKNRLEFVERWIKLFDTHKKILSDENSYLIGLADMIYTTTLYHNLEISIKYVEICLPQMRLRPYGLDRATFLCKRFMFSEMAEKPILESKQAIDEAFETVKIVYGEKHELTLWLLEKKFEYDCAARFGMR